LRSPTWIRFSDTSTQEARLERAPSPRPFILAINSLAENPLGSRATSDPQIRIKVVGRYGYKIFYSAGNEAVEILHVRHGARRPWSSER
jgi:hypothetical protein